MTFPARAIGLLPKALGATAVAALVALLVYGVLVRSPSHRIDDRLSRGLATAAPGFTLEVLQRGAPRGRLAAVVHRAAADGKIALRELGGTPLVINIWASWCDPCREEAPRLERTWSAARDGPVLFLGLDQQDTPEDARTFMRAFHVDYPNIRDPSDDVPRRYGATGVPETYFIDARGRVVDHVIGVIEPEQLRAGIAAAARGVVRGSQQGGARRDQR